MQLKIYTSFHQINNELEILKLEKELNYQKLALSFERAKEVVQPHSIKNELLFYIKEQVTDSFKNLILVAIPYVVNFLKGKRG